ncbi:MAG: ferric uptake regulator, Fur family [Chloroflexota bacterium]|nr:ferric uptake regulator, Fur family [Chloroflexota bacterium]
MLAEPEELSQPVASAGGCARPILRAMNAGGSIAPPGAGSGSSATWSGIPDRLRARGLRWTPQRRVLVEVLSRTDGHVTGVELVERCRELDPGTIPSTVYRTLDVLEELGVLSHSHGADGREEFHVLPETEHGHLYCQRCGGQWELAADDPAVLAAVDSFAAQRGFAVNVSHLTMIGRCAACQAEAGETG